MDLPHHLLTQPFTLADGQPHGLTLPVLRRLLRDGEVRRVLTGVYAHRSLSDSLEMRAAAAALVVPPTAVMCDRTAAWLHGVDVLAFWELELVPPLEMVVLPEFTRVRRARALGGRRDLAAEDIWGVRGLQVTSPLRTALDLGCKLGRRDAVAAVDALMRRFAISRTELMAELPRFGGRRGVVQLRSVAEIADPRSESPGESWLRTCVIDAGLPRPEVQVWVEADGAGVYRLDLGYSKLLIGMEFDGVETHSTVEQRRHDEERRAWLQSRGWEVLVVRKEDFTAERLPVWSAELRTLIDARRRVRGNPGVRRWSGDLSRIGRDQPQAP